MIFNAISAASGGGGAKIATGSYVGTGTYGSSNPCSLTFDFEPKIVFISRVVSGSYVPQNFFSQYGVQVALSWISDITTQKIELTWDGATVSWYNEDHSVYQLNAPDYTYKWLAVG